MQGSRGSLLCKSRSRVRSGLGPGHAHVVRVAVVPAQLVLHEPGWSRGPGALLLSRELPLFACLSLSLSLSPLHFLSLTLLPFALSCSLQLGGVVAPPVAVMEHPFLRLLLLLLPKCVQIMRNQLQLA